MKKYIALYLLLFCASRAFSQQKVDSTQKLIVEASCGQCNFGMKGNSCDLAVRINGKAYIVDGTKIDDHGDAHAADGFCMAIKKAEVVGEIVGDRFKSVYFKLIDTPK